MQVEKICRNCGNRLNENEKYCTECGTQWVESVCKQCGTALAPGQAFCSKCGCKAGSTTDEDKKSAIDNYNANVGKKKSKGIVAVICVLIAVILLLGGIFTWCLSRADWSMDLLSTIISGKHYSCLVEHSFSEATCIQGPVCTECGLENGQPAGHKWVEATCTEPKKCSVCNQKEGEAKGHKVRIGKCDACGEYAGELSMEWSDILSDYTDAISDFGKAVNYLSDAASSKYFSSLYIDYAKEKLSSAKKKIKSAADSCGDYEEFADIKARLLDAYNAMNTTSSSLSTLVSASKTALGKLDGIEKLLYALIESK